jgi:hypothetical protein
MTGVGILVGFVIGASVFGALAPGASPDTIMLGELVIGLTGSAIGGAAGWFGSQTEIPTAKKHKKR